MRNALYTVGAPILQSAISTMLGVMFLASAESYMFKSFLKTIFLVILLGVLHGLVVLPVLLTSFHCSCDMNDNIKGHEDKMKRHSLFLTRPAIQFVAGQDLFKPLAAGYQLRYLVFFKDAEKSSKDYESDTVFSRN
ncbi:hypothetical protein KIN20_003870 [Parelaphostrongylus tenuis]|uniref:Uncharacterized protein n=1 Tax=Parelaphostrongylus tenuis TaxID=148309 RepID=A0AAD5LZT4_PARTN|nr:hypothetical protein KIN20_003870 [Parelaphostrongylus tenuis]